MLTILEDVVTHGQSYDISSFKSGTITMVDRFLYEICAQSGLKANLHIESKLKSGRNSKHIIRWTRVTLDGMTH